MRLLTVAPSGRNRPGRVAIFWVLVSVSAAVCVSPVCVSPVWADQARSGTGIETIRLLTSSASGATVEVTAPWPEITPSGDMERFEAQGWERTSDPGAPNLPATGFSLAVPPGTRPVLRVEVLSSGLAPGRPVPVPTFEIVPDKDELPVQLADHTPDAAVYAQGYPMEWARLGPVSTLRHLRLVRVELYPYRWDPSAGGVQVATRMRLEVRFEAESGQGLIPGQPRRGAAPQTDSRPASRNQAFALGEPVSADHPVWERLYGQAALNRDEARAWSRSPRRWPSARAQRNVQTGPEIRISVNKTDLVRVTYRMLADAGWDAEAVPVEQVTLVERFYDESDAVDPFREELVPIVVRDRNENQVFDSNDDLLFFGQTIWDRAHPPAKDRRYGRVHAYFLSARSEGGARMDTGSSFLAREDLSPESEFVWTERFERDGEYMRSADTSRDLPSFLPLGVDAVRIEHFYWFGGNPGSYTDQFDLPGIIAPLRVRIALQGITYPEQSPIPVPACQPILRAGPARDSLTVLPGNTRFNHKTFFLYAAEGADLEAIRLRSTGNWFGMENPVDAWGGALDWFEWTYRRGFNATLGRVSWTTSDLTGPREFRPAGFSIPLGDDLFLFDLTDSLRTNSSSGPRFLPTNAAGQRFRGEDNKWTLRVQLDLGQSATPRVLTAVVASTVGAPYKIERSAPDDLTVPTSEGEEDLIIITAPEFVDGLAPLAEQRRREGLSVRVVSVQDVFDLFNGGRAWPTAIRSYLRYLFRERDLDPSFLLLVGDASDDFANVLPESARNFVPTQTVFSNAYSSQGPELVSSDEWFVDDLQAPGDSLDFYPDMHVGRLPVSNLAELSLIVNKLLEYSTFHEGETWRQRGLLVSDDEFSSRISFTDTYQWRADEHIFRTAGQETQRIIQEEAGFAEFVTDSFYTACYMDTVACLGRCNEPITDGSAVCNENWRCPMDSLGNLLHGLYRGALVYADPNVGSPIDNYDYGRTVLPPLLRNKMNRGHLFVSYQGHANARLMSHEYIFQDAPFVDRNDCSRLENLGKPFVYMGYGCHLAEFSVHNEGAGNRGDCISEKLLFQDRGRGAIASFASTGYEWLNDNDVMNLALFRSWFPDPPQFEGHARWILGEIMSGGKYRMMNLGGGRNRQGMVATYTLLGDPSMPLDVGAPRLQVELNGAPWVDGQAVAAEAGSDTLRIRVRLQDEVSLGEITVLEGGVAVDPSRYQILADPERPEDNRRAVLLYEPELAPPLENYDIEIRTLDGSGRSTTLRFPVQLNARFDVLRGGSPVPIQPADILEPRDSLLVTVTSPVDLSGEQIDLWLDGGPLAVSRSSSDPRVWSLRAALPVQLSKLDHSLFLRVRRADATVAQRSAAFHGASTDGVRIVLSYNFPNPFEAGTQFHYRLSGSALSARVSVFTSSGRRIWQAEGTSRPNENVIDWDGRDRDGDPVSNGLYFYKLEVKTLDGKTLTKIDRLARIR